ncbi:ankyrin repeat-containing domain protein [Xylariales sp. AK1849]|nr:ankyrin repeat-containing domain protein [Xylariales sp. AK1849]
MMRLFHFAPELVGRIFDAIACSREFKRVMRLRLVSRQFKHFIDDTIFRLRLLDDIPIIAASWVDSARRHVHWHAFVLEYLAYQAWVEKKPDSLLGRIRRAAVTLSEQVGDKGRDAIIARLKPLCRLALGHSTWPGYERALFQFNPWQGSPECSDEELEADLCVAAICLGHRAHIEKLISQGHQFCNWGEVKDIFSAVFGQAYSAAAFKGDASMLRLLLSSNPSYNPLEPLPSYLQRYILSSAAIYGHKDAFDFALDSGPLDLVSGEHEDSRQFPEYECLSDAIASTRFPDNYKRGAALFVPNSKVFDPRRGESLPTRLAKKAADGHVEMVQYFVRQGISPNQEAGRGTGLSSGDWKYQPLLQAVYGGSPEVVSLLLDHGADPNWFSVIDTALMASARVSAVSIAKMLLAAGARVDEGCPPPIVVAVFKEDMDMFRLLRKHGARLDTPETGGWAMAVAQFYELASMVDVLVREGVERGAILRRCAEREEEYQPQYLFPQCALDLEDAWLSANENDQDTLV